MSKLIAACLALLSIGGLAFGLPADATRGTREARASDALASRPSALDPSFGHGGETVIQANPSCVRGCVEFFGSYAEALALLPGGDVLLGGNDSGFGPGGGRSWLARLNSRGVLDLSYGRGGLAETGLPVSHVSTLPHGGVVSFDPDHLERFTADGNPDRSFGHEGIRSLSKLHRSVDAARDALGRIVVLGTTFPHGIAVRRFLPSGAIDAKFGSHGTALLRGRPTAEPVAFAIQPDGGVVIAAISSASATVSGGREPLFPFLARFTAAGTLDTSFGKRGIARLPIPVTTSIKIAVADDGHVMLAAGENPLGATRREKLLLVRYTAGGQLDRKFGVHGIASRAFPEPRTGRAGMMIPSALAFDSGGDTVVVGANVIRTIDTGSAGTWFVARYTRTGLDCSFGTHGFAFGDGRGGASAVAVQPNGRIVIAGDSGHAFMAARYEGGGIPRTCIGEG